MIDPHDELFSIRDILDSQLLTSDGRRIGRVADIEAELRADGSLRLTYLIAGPQALAGRVNHGLGRLFHFVLRDRFEHRIPIGEVKKFGPTLLLRGKAEQYEVGQSDRWIAEHILRWIPGSGR
jgi:sporulation protein YlmC with PRC-barrel domain